MRTPISRATTTTLLALSLTACVATAGDAPGSDAGEEGGVLLDQGAIGVRHRRREIGERRTDAGVQGDDAGSTASADSGAPSDDAGGTADAGAPEPHDTGTTSDDAGVEPQDTGTTHADSGMAAEPDTGVATSDAGSTTGATYVTSYLTFYGWPDNSPAGAGIALPVIHSSAGGTGTYADPITFATAPTEFAAGTILYLPYLQKYVIMEDTCTACTGDWAAGKRHIDVWMNSNGVNDTKLLACQDAWTRDAVQVELHPPSNRPVVTTPLFTPATGVCLTPPA